MHVKVLKKISNVYLLYFFLLILVFTYAWYVGKPFISRMIICVFIYVLENLLHRCIVQISVFNPTAEILFMKYLLAHLFNYCHMELCHHFRCIQSIHQLEIFVVSNYTIIQVPSA